MTPAEIVNAWFAKWFQNNFISQNQQLYSHVNAAMLDLVGQLSIPAPPGVVEEAASETPKAIKKGKEE
jgi:hypothetical protein